MGIFNRFVKGGRGFQKVALILLALILAILNIQKLKDIVTILTIIVNKNERKNCNIIEKHNRTIYK